MPTPSPTTTDWVPLWALQQGTDLSGYQTRAEKGAANGYASLDANGKVPNAQLSNAPGAELAYAQITSPVTIGGTDWPSAITAITTPATSYDGSPVVAEFFSPYCQLVDSPAIASVVYGLFIDSTEIGQALWQRGPQTQGLYIYMPLALKVRYTPSAGSHTFSLRAYNSAPTTGGVSVTSNVIGAGAGGTGYFPAYVRVTKV